MRKARALALLCLFGAALTGVACGSDDDGDKSSAGGGGAGGSPDNVGSTCKTPSDCYPGVDPTKLSGTVECLDRIDEGYCTHLCNTDADCCAVEGECKTDLKQVCSPFESGKTTKCFLSCEDADLNPPDGGAKLDSAEYCQKYASSDFICRSSGGGANNRKVCVPGDCGVGEACKADSECATGLACITSLKGGYCGKADCKSDTDCPTGSLCSTIAGKNYCLATCVGDTDCSFCRPWDLRATCKADIKLVGPATTGSVCVPPS